MLYFLPRNFEVGKATYFAMLTLFWLTITCGIYCDGDETILGCVRYAYNFVYSWFCKWNYSTIFYWVMRIMMFVLEFRILELLWIFCYRDGHSYIEHSKHKLRSFCWSRYPLKLTTNLNKTKWSHKFMIHHDEVIF